MNVSTAYLRYIAYRLRLESIVSTTEAGSGHPTSCLSAADIMAVLFFDVMNYDAHNPENPNNDRFILSKGHAAPVLYAAWREKGVLTDAELLTLRKFDSVLEGHPTPRFAYVEAATGSLGMGLSIGIGIALTARLNGSDHYTYVLMGDSEVAEGSVWEAMELASYYKLNRLIGIIDINSLGQSTHTMDGYDLEKYKAKCEAFGFRTFIVDGHTIDDLVEVFKQVRTPSDKPSMILAKTVKGYGIASVEGKEGYHGKAFSKKELPGVLDELKKRFPIEAAEKFDELIADRASQKSAKSVPLSHVQTSYKLSEEVATRKAYGAAVTMVGTHLKDIVCLDGEVKNSTFAEIFEKSFPDRFFQCFIAEQTMVGMGIGFACQDKIPFISTFGAFFSRAHDQIRMAAISQVALRLVGSHAGVSIGEDGPSQMALEDIGLMRALPSSVVFYPSDAVSAAKLVACMASYTQGISYLRTTRAATPVIYKNTEEFVIGGCKVLRQSAHDSVCIVAAGITLHQALAAYEKLSQENIFVTVIDCYSIKPLDVSTIRACARAAGKRLITVEDHYIEGGLGESVAYELRNDGITMEALAVTKLPRSGSPEELLAFEQIDAAAIVNTVRRLCSLL